MKVFTILVNLREGTDIEKIKESFDKKYKSEGGNHIFDYKVEKAGKEIMISLNSLENSVSYRPIVKEPQASYDFSEESFLEFDGLIKMTVSQVAKQFDYTLTEENMEDGDFDIYVDDNEIFNKVMIQFDPDEDPEVITTVILVCKSSSIKQENLEGWYKDHYIDTGDPLNPYCSEGEEYYIRFKVSGNTTNVYYSTTKARR